MQGADLDWSRRLAPRRATARADRSRRHHDHGGSHAAGDERSRRSRDGDLPGAAEVGGVGGPDLSASLDAYRASDHFT